ncbi:hypothetical protein GEMRC1_013892 [Eukaryota sp. GEM-RC1]
MTNVASSCLISIDNIIGDLDSIGGDYLEELKRVCSELISSNDLTIKQQLLQVLFCGDHNTPIHDLLYSAKNEKNSKDLAVVITDVLHADTNFFVEFISDPPNTAVPNDLKSSLYHAFLQARYSITKQHCLAALSELFYSLSLFTSPHESLSLDPSLESIVVELLRQSTTSITSSVKGEIYKFLGRLFIHFPSYMSTYHKKFATSLLQHAIYQPDTPSLFTGAITGLHLCDTDSPIVRLIDESFVVASGCVRTVVKSKSGDRLASAIPEGCIKLISECAPLYRAKIFKNFHSLFDDLMVLTTKVSSSSFKLVIVTGMNSIVENISKTLVNDDYDFNERFEIFEYFLKLIDATATQTEPSSILISFTIVGHIAQPLSVFYPEKCQSILMSKVQNLIDFKRKFESRLTTLPFLSNIDVSCVCAVSTSFSLTISHLISEPHFIVDSAVAVVSLVFSTLSFSFKSAHDRLVYSLSTLFLTLNHFDLLERVLNRAVPNHLIDSLSSVVVKDDLEYESVTEEGESKAKSRANFSKYWCFLSNYFSHFKHATSSISHLPQSQVLSQSCSASLTVFLSLSSNILLFVERLAHQIIDQSTGEEVSAKESNQAVYNAELFCRLLYLYQVLLFNNPLFVPVVASDHVVRLLGIFEISMKSADCWIIFDCLRVIVQVSSGLEWILSSVCAPKLSKTNSDFFDHITSFYTDPSLFQAKLSTVFSFLVPKLHEFTTKTQASAIYLLCSIPSPNLEYFDYIKLGLNLPAQYTNPVYYCLKLLHSFLLFQFSDVNTQIDSSLANSIQKLIGHAPQKEEVSTISIDFFIHKPPVSLDFSSLQPSSESLQTLALNVLIKVIKMTVNDETSHFPMFDISVDLQLNEEYFNFSLDTTLPHVLRLCESQSKSTRVLAFESLHSLVTKLSAQILSKSLPSIDYSNIISVIIPKILIFASSGDTIARQLFRDLVIQLGRLLIYIHLNMSPIQELSAFISSTVSSLGDRGNASLRTFSAAVLTSMLYYLLKQLAATQSNDDEVYDLLFRPLLSLSRASSFSERVGVCEVFLFEPGVSNVAFHRIFRNNVFLSSKYTLSFFGSVIKTMIDCGHDLPPSLSDTVLVFTKICKLHLKALLETNETRVDFPNITEFFKFSGGKLKVASFQVKKSIFNIFRTLIPLVSQQLNLGNSITNYLNSNVEILKLVKLPKFELNSNFASIQTLDNFASYLYWFCWLKILKIPVDAQRVPQLFKFISMFSNFSFESFEPGASELLGDILVEILRFSSLTKVTDSESGQAIVSLFSRIFLNLGSFQIPQITLDEIFPKISTAVGVFLNRTVNKDSLKSVFSELFSNISTNLKNYSDHVSSSSFLYSLSFAIELLSRNLSNLIDQSLLISTQRLSLQVLQSIPSFPSWQNSTSTKVVVLYLLLTPPSDVLSQLSLEQGHEQLGSKVLDLYFKEFTVFLIDKTFDDVSIWTDYLELFTYVLNHFRKPMETKPSLSQDQLQQFIHFTETVVVSPCSSTSQYLVALEFSSSALSFVMMFPNVVVPESVLSGIVTTLSYLLKQSRYMGRIVEKCVFVSQILTNFEKCQNVSLFDSVLIPLSETIPPNPISLDPSSTAYVSSLERFEHLLQLIPSCLIVSSKFCESGLQMILPFLAWELDPDDSNHNKWRSTIADCCKLIVDKVVLQQEAFILSFIQNSVQLMCNPMYFKSKRQFRDLLIIPLISHPSIDKDCLKNIMIAIVPGQLDVGLGKSDDVISPLIDSHDYSAVASHYVDRSTALFIISHFYKVLDSDFLRDEFVEKISRPTLGKELITKLAPTRVENSPAFLQDPDIPLNLKNFIIDALFELRQAAFSTIAWYIVKAAKQEKQDQLVNAYVLQPSAKHPIWSDFLLDSSKLPLFPSETNFSVENNEESRTSAEALVHESSLSLSSSIDPYFSSSVKIQEKTTSGLETSPEAYELDFFNSIPIMMPLLAALDWLPTSTPMEQRPPFKTILNILTGNFSLYVKCFFVKVILNRPSLFNTCLDSLLEPMLSVMILESSSERIKSSPGIHYFLRDFCLTVLEMSKNSNSLKPVAENNPSLSSDFFAILCHRFAWDESRNYAMIRSNLSIISQFISVWSPWISLDFNAVLYLFNKAFKNSKNSKTIGRSPSKIVLLELCYTRQFALY